MATPVSTNTSAAAPVSPTTPVVQPATSAGLSSVASSLAPATDQGFSGQISACIASIFETIRGCLARLPCIGYWFESTPVTTITPPVTIPNPTTIGWTDAQLVSMIRGAFPSVSAVSAITSTTTVPVIPPPDMVNYLLSLFGQIQAPDAKIDAFHSVLDASNSNDGIAKQFYDALPEGTGVPVEASKSAFRHQIWAANGSSVYNGHDHGPGFGDHIVYGAIRGPLAQQAAINLRTALIAARTASTTRTP